MHIKKILLPVALISIIGAFVVYRQFFSNPAPATTTNQNSASHETINPGTSENSGQTAATGTQMGYKDGQYQGDVANTVYGDVQVKVTINSGKITSIDMVKAPNSPGHTTELTKSSFPILISEALQTQKSQVDIVSGATQNSEGFSQSLASALAKAS
jgi:uncharacterized protein with FMN-binding domain